jgi:RNA polymerase sigma-70 factor, ECF subfamily
MYEQLGKQIEMRNASAFRSLFVAFFPKVKAMLIRQGIDADTAEEIAQDTMLAVWRKSHQFSIDRGTPSAWIFAIARNLRIDRIRKRVLWQRFCTELETAERLQSAADDVQSLQADSAHLEGVLGRLPPTQLQVIQLAFVDGLSQGEIAERLNLPLGTVKSRMRLGFEKLRCFADRGP